MRNIIAVTFFLLLSPLVHADIQERENLARQVVDFDMEASKDVFAKLDEDLMSKIENEQDADKKAYLKTMFRGGIFKKKEMEELKSIVIKVFVEKMDEKELAYLLEFKKSSTNKKLLEIEKEKEKIVMPFVFSLLSRKFQEASQEFSK